MDPTRGDSRYNLNYGMGGIGLSLADQADLYGNPAAVLASGGGGGLNNRPPSGGLIQSMGGGGGGSGSGRSSSGLMHHSSTGGNSSNQCQTLGGSGGNSNQQQQQQQQQQSSRGIKRTSSGCYEDHHRNSAGQQMSSQGLQNLDNCGPGGQHSGNGTPQDMVGGGSGGGGGGSGNPDENYTSLQTNKKSPPANGKKTKGRVKIKMEYIDNKLRRYTTFSKRKTGIMKKAYELSTLTGTQVMLLVASETGHVYTFATRKLQPMITSEAGKQLIQTCLNSPDPPPTGGTGDQRMSATGFEETELSYNIADEDSKDDRSPCSSGNETDDSSDMDSPCPISSNIKNSCGIGSNSSGNAIPNEITLPDSPIIISTNNSNNNNNNNNNNNKNNNSSTIHNIISNQQQKHSSSHGSGTGGHHHHHHNQQQQSSQIITSTGGTSSSSQHNPHHGGNSTNSNSGGSGTTTISGTSNTSNVQFSGINNVLYPSTLANIPQEVLLSLVQAGHLQLHTDEDGSGHQIISIPLTMTSNNSGSSNLSGNNGNNGNSSRNTTNTVTNNNNNQFGLLTSTSSSSVSTSTSSTANIIGISSDNTLIPSNSTVGHIVSINNNNNNSNNSNNIGGGINKIHVKDLSNKIGNSSSNNAFEISTAVLVSGGTNGRESPSSAPPPPIRIKKEIE